MLANAPEKKTPASATQTAVVQVPKSPAGPRPGSVHLEIVLPQATQVSVAGSFNDWTPEKNPLKPAGQNRWVADLNIQPGRHEYLFVADGQWLPDPNARETVANPFGGSNSVLTVN